MREEGVTDKQFKFFENEGQFMSNAAKTPRPNCVVDTTKAEKAVIAHGYSSYGKYLQSILSKTLH